MKVEVHKREFAEELTFKVSRSSGPGGQHVNTTNSRVTLCFDVQKSVVLSEREKSILLVKEAGRINQTGIMQMHEEGNRSQLRNKEVVVRRFYQLLKKTYKKVKIRKATKPSLSAINKRIQHKKEHSEKKTLRKRIL